MIATLQSIPSMLLGPAKILLMHVSQTLLYVSFFLSAAYSFGWIDRFFWYVLETEASKILNGTPVTVGSLQVDLIRGKAWMSNVVLHSPKRHLWKWQSPVLARVGKVYVECNLVQCVFYDWILREDLPLEIYTLHVSDIQCFVERRQQVFNFYLMDPHNVLPDPQDLDDEEEEYDEVIPTIQKSNEDSFDQNHEDTSNSTSAPSSDHAVVEEQETAQKLVDEMMRAVQSLGRAARKGGSLQGALVEHRQTIATKLKKLKAAKKSEAIQEGAKIVQQVSKAVVKKTGNVHQVVVPERREIKGEKIVYARFGPVVIEDMRIFTRDHWDADENKKESSWNRPIVIQQMAIRAAEFCPPLSAKQDNNFPVLYQTIDKSLDVIWKRVLAETAKSNSGRLFQTAMGEMLDYYLMDLEMELQNNSETF